ncbi:hypothetical protein ACVW1A_005966 [Bradyrhizobium sp. LB1.3]
MLKNATDADIHWFVGLFESFGAIQIANKAEKPTLVLEFKTAYLDKLWQICRALGYEGSPSGRRNPTGHSVRPQYILRLSGTHYAMIENLLVKLLRTGKREMFAQRRAELRALREGLGLSGGKYLIDAAEKA